MLMRVVGTSFTSAVHCQRLIVCMASVASFFLHGGCCVTISHAMGHIHVKIFFVL